ncbi:MAG: hypothetical protein ABFC94_16250 [Syntrophomonas sp.]
MDERDIVNSMIEHINNAKTELANFSKSNLSPKSKTELDLAYKSLDHSIVHCQGIFGPAK